MDEDFRFDIRIRDRMVAAGNITKEEVEARLSSLKDVEPESELVELEQPALEPLVVTPEGEGEGA
jgi:hypothetical protein